MVDQLRALQRQRQKRRPTTKRLARRRWRVCAHSTAKEPGRDADRDARGRNGAHHRDHSRSECGRRSHCDVTIEDTALREAGPLWTRRVRQSPLYAAAARVLDKRHPRTWQARKPQSRHAKQWADDRSEGFWAGLASTALVRPHSGPIGREAPHPSPTPNPPARKLYSGVVRTAPPWASMTGRQFMWHLSALVYWRLSRRVYASILTKKLQSALRPSANLAYSGQIPHSFQPSRM